MKILYGLCLLAFGSASLAACADTCDSDLIVATTNVSNSKHSDWRLSYTITKDNYKEVKHNLSADAVVYEVPVGADYSDYEQNRANFSKTYGESLTVAQAFSLLHTGLDEFSVAAYKSCLDKEIFTSTGLHVKIADEQENDIALYVKLAVPRAGSNARISWTPSSINGKPIPSTIANGGSVDIVIERPKKETILVGNYGNGYPTQPITLYPVAIGKQQPAKIEPLHAIYVGTTPDRNQGEMTTDKNYKHATNLLAGYTIKSPLNRSDIELYLGDSTSNKGTVAVRSSDFMHGSTVPIGYAFREDPNMKGSQALYSISGVPPGTTDKDLKTLCAEKDGLVSTSDSQLGCHTNPVGWLLPP